MRFLQLLWRHRATVLVSAILAAAVGVFFGLTGPTTLTSNGQLLLPAIDPVSASPSGSGSKPDNSLVGIQVKSYADATLGDDVRRALGKEAPLLTSFSATRGRDPLFWRVTASADKGPVARTAVQAGADALINKATELSKAQIDKLQALVTERLGPLDQQSVTAAADEISKQTAYQSLQDQAKSLQGQIDAAREAATRAVVSGKGSATAGGSIASGTQAQLDAVNKQLITAQVAYEQAKSKSGVIDAQRQGLRDQMQKATDSYLSSQVSASLAAPPSKPVSGRKLRLVTMVALEIILSLAVASASIAWLERRQLQNAVRTRFGRRRRKTAGGWGVPAAAHARGRH